MNSARHHTPIPLWLIFNEHVTNILANFERNYKNMERVINLHIKKLPEGYYLATSDNIQGLVAQGRTISETIEIAKDVAKKLIEAQEEQIPKLKTLSDSFDYPLVIGV
jgi:predicted RNase H-like HicB family nuclease